LEGFACQCFPKGKWKIARLGANGRLPARQELKLSLARLATTTFIEER